MKRPTGILLALLLSPAGCGQVASRNPLESSIAPPAPAALCSSRYSFEAPGSQAPWQAPSWAPGNSGAPARVATDAVCGSYALRQHLVLTGASTSYALLYATLPESESMDGRNLALSIRFDPAPPADLGVRPQFIDLNNEWVGTGQPARFALGQGWVLVTRSFQGPEFAQVMAFNLQIVTNNGVPYVGDLWIDEISW